MDARTVLLPPSVVAGVLMTLALFLVWCAPASAEPLFREVPYTGLPTTGKSFGATWADVDRDGRLDFLIGHHGQGMGVYLNRAGLAFARQDSCAVLPCVDIDQHGTAACDYDNDGDWELYVTVGADLGEGSGANEMWMLGQEGTYRNALPPGHFMADAQGRGRGALWVRLDTDRFPELIVLNYQRPTRMFRFDGQRWQDRSEPLNPYLVPTPTRRALQEGRGLWFSAAAAGDLDLDGHCDLILSGDGNFLFRNDGAGGVTDETVAAGLPPVADELMSTVLGDVDNDGDLDAVQVYRRSHGLQLWLNQSTPGVMRFVKSPGLDDLALAPELDSVVLADLDNDGRQDLYVMMQGEGGENVPNLMARGLGDGSFVDVSSTWGGLAGVEALPRGAWPLDLDGDGDLDLMAIGGKEDFPERSGLAVLYENRATNAGLTLELATSGGAPHGLGARVELHATAGVQFKQVRSVLNHWNATVLPLHFGLGEDPGPYRVVVTWPNGRRQELSLPRGGVGYRLQQGAEAAEMLAEY